MTTTETRPKVLIVDDHVIIRRGLKFILESNFGIREYFETESCSGLLEIVAKEPISHIILDMQLTDGNVIEILSDLLEKYRQARVLIYTMSPEELFGARLLNMGVAGFLNKNATEKEVIKALDLFFRGQKYISQLVHDQLESNLPLKSVTPINDLSERELVVMNYLLTGEGIKEISTRMNLKSSTVATFKARIFNKLKVTNVIDLKNLAEIYKIRRPADKETQ